MSETTVVCGDCQTENSPENDFCSNCGLPLPRSAAEEEKINESQQSHGDGERAEATAT